MTLKPAGRSKRAKPLRIRCGQCELMRINGVVCHETGCPNTHARYDVNSGEWIKQRKCFDCGCMVDAEDPCCSERAIHDNEEEWWEAV